MSTDTTTVPTPSPGARRALVQGPTLVRLAQVELRKSSDTRAGFWLLLVIALTSPAVAVLQMFFAEEPDKTFSMFIANTQLPVALLLPVLGILLVTSEWSQRTAMTTFALVPARSRVLTAKVLVGVILGLLGVAAAAVAATLGALLTPVLTSDSSDWGVSGDQVVRWCSSRCSRSSSASPSACCCSARRWPSSCTSCCRRPSPSW